MMKFLLLIVLITWTFCTANAQNDFSGKYLVETFMVEKAFPCYKVKYCILKFSKDSVEVSYPIKRYCYKYEKNKKDSIYNITPIKKYKWKIVKGKLFIPKFKNFEISKFEEKDLNFINGLYSKPKKVSGKIKI